MSQLAELTTITQKRFQCRHVHATGRQCGSPALRKEQFCYFHHTTRHTKKTGGFRYLDATEPFELPIVEDRASALSAAAQIFCRIASNDLDLGRAGKLLYNLQILNAFLPREKAVPESTPQPVPAPQLLVEELVLVEALVLDETHGLIAPITELPEPFASRYPEDGIPGLQPWVSSGLSIPTEAAGTAASRYPEDLSSGLSIPAEEGVSTPAVQAAPTNNEERTTDNDPLQNCHPERSSASAPNAVEGPAVASHTATAESAIPTKAARTAASKYPEDGIPRLQPWVSSGLSSPAEQGASEDPAAPTNNEEPTTDNVLTTLTAVAQPASTPPKRRPNEQRRTYNEQRTTQPASILNTLIL